MHRDEGAASFRLIDPTNSVTSIVKTFQELGKNLGSIVILPIVRYRPAPTSPRVHEDSKDRCSLLNDRELLLRQSSVFSKKQRINRCKKCVIFAKTLRHVVGLRHEGRGVEGFTPSVKRKSDFRVGGGKGETSVPSPAWPIVADRSIDRGIVSARLIYLRRG